MYRSWVSSLECKSCNGWTFMLGSYSRKTVFVVGLEELASCEKSRDRRSRQEGWPEWANYREDQTRDSRETGWNGIHGYRRQSKTVKDLKAQQWAFVLRGSSDIPAHRGWGGFACTRWGGLYEHWFLETVQKWFSLVKNRMMTMLEDKEVLLLAQMKFYLDS